MCAKIFWHHLKVRGLFHSEVLVRCTALSPGRHRTSAWARVPERDTEPWCSYMTIHVFLPFSGAAAAAASFSAADSLWEPLPSFHDTQRCDSGILDITLSTCMPQPVQVARPHALHFAWRHISNRSRCSLRSAVLPDGRESRRRCHVVAGPDSSARCNSSSQIDHDSQHRAVAAPASTVRWSPSHSGYVPPTPYSCVAPVQGLYVDRAARSMPLPRAALVAA